MAPFGGDAAAGDALEQDVLIDVDADSDDGQHVGDEFGVEPLGLVERAREAVEDVAVFGVRLG